MAFDCGFNPSFASTSALSFERRLLLRHRPVVLAGMTRWPTQKYVIVRSAKCVTAIDREYFSALALTGATWTLEAARTDGSSGARKIGVAQWICRAGWAPARLCTSATKSGDERRVDLNAFA